MKLKIERRSLSPVHIIWGPLALFFLFFMSVFRDFTGLAPRCLFHQVTGYPCMTCGATRSALSLAGFDLSRALYFNPLIPVAILALIILSAVGAWSYFFNMTPVLHMSRGEKVAIRIGIFSLLIINWAWLITAGV